MPRIKSFENFSSQNNDEVNEGLWDDITGVFSKIMPSLGQGFITTVKQKITAAAIQKVGVKEDSVFSGIIQEVIAAIPLSDFPGIITGSKVNTDYLAPILAQATQNVIQRKGLETLLAPFGAEPNGWLVATARNSIQGEIGRENLEKMWRNILGAEPFGEGGLASQFTDQEKQKFTNAITQQAAKSYPLTKSSTSRSTSSSGGNDFDMVTNMIKGLFSPSENQSR